MSVTVVLVRHALPTVDPAVPPANGSAALGGGAVRRDERLAEAGRPQRWEPDHRRVAREYVAGTRLPGWESHADVVARFDEGVRDAAAVARGRPVVAATTGCS